MPDLAFVEVANAVAVSVRGGKLSAGDAERALDVLLGLPLRAVPSKELAAAALRVALAREVSAYDACYLALAEAADAVLVTADGKLAREAENAALLPKTGPPG